MNIRNFCLYPKGSDRIPYFRAARYLWLPLERVRKCPIEMEDPCVVFNISEEEVGQDNKKYFFEITDDRWRDPSLQLPVEAIERAYAYADKAIDWGKEHNERFRQNHDRFVEHILQPNRTGYSRWLLRGLLYGSLLDAYRANQ